MEISCLKSRGTPVDKLVSMVTQTSLFPLVKAGLIFPLIMLVDNIK